MAVQTLVSKVRLGSRCGYADVYVDAPNAAGVLGLAPTAPHGVQVGTADAAMGDFDVNVGLFPLLGLEFLPLQLAVHAVRAVAQPALEFVRGGHVCKLCSWSFSFFS